MAIFDINGIDISMCGPLSATEQIVWDQWMTEWRELITLVPQCKLLENSFGQWRIEKYGIIDTVSRHLFRKDLRNGFTSPNVWTPPGTYTRLTTDKPTVWGWPGGVIMHDQMEELRFIADCLVGTAGDILECGLGLGLFISAALMRPDVTSLTIVEIEPDILKEIGGRFADKRLKLIKGDFRTYDFNGATFDTVWLDTIGTHNTPAVVAKYQEITSSLKFYESPVSV